MNLTNFSIKLKIKYFLLTVHLLTVLLAVGQTQKIPDHLRKYEDSLATVLTIAANDTIKVKQLNHLSRKIYYYDFKKGLSYINQSIQLAERLDFKFGIVNGHYFKGIIYYYISDYDLALEEFFTVLDLNKTLEYQWFYGATHNYIGIVYNKLDKFEESLYHYEKSLKYHQKENHFQGVADVSNNMGLIFFKQGNYDKALTFYKEGLLDDDEDPESISNSFLNMIAVHLKQNDLKNAKQKLEVIDGLKNQITDPLIITELYYTKGLFYQALGDSENAMNLFNLTVDFGKKKKIWEYVQKASKELSSLYGKQNDYELSLNYYKDYTAARDSINNIEIQKRIIQLENARDKEIYEAELKVKQKAKQVTYLFYILVILIICATLAFLYYRQRKNVLLRKQEYEYKINSYKDKLQHSSQEKSKLEYDLIYNKKELAFKNNELVNFALQIIQNDELIKEIRKRIKSVVPKLKTVENLKAMEELDVFVRQSMNLDKSRNEFYTKTKSLHKNFLYKLKEKFPGLSSKEVELALLLRLKYSSKEISSLLNISPKSVDMARYRLRKKLSLDSKVSLSKFLNSVE